MRRHPLHSRPSFRLPVLLAVALALSACASVPAIDALPPATSDAAPPALVPIDDLLAQAAGPSVAESAGAALAARAARLKARARLMRGPVLDPDTRAALAEAIAEGRA